MLTSPQPILIIFCQYLSQSTDQRLYCTFRDIPVMQGLGVKKERHIFKGATACKCILSISEHYELSHKHQCQTNRTSDIFVLAPIFIFISSKHSLAKHSYKEDTPSHQSLYTFIFINIFINIFSYFPAYQSLGR